VCIVTRSTDQNEIRRRSPTGKSLNQAVRDYLEQLAGRPQLAAELKAFETSALSTPGRLAGWKFDCEEANRRA